MKRRDFVVAAAGGMLGVSSAERTVAAQGSGRLGPIGVQLYTLRAMAEKNLARTLASVARAGYKEVEFAGYFGHPVAQVKKMLDDNGLASPSAHIQMNDLGIPLEGLLEDANTLGQKYLTVAWIDEAERTRDGYKRVADRLNEASVKAKRESVRLAYHNHAYEFAPLAGSGQSGFGIVLRSCRPEDLAMEADIFWMRKAGQDPLKWFAAYPGRFHMLHIKDMGRAPKNAMLDVGKGVIDWRAILARQSSAGVKHVFVEHDEAKDPVASIRASYRYLRALRFPA